MKNKIYLCLIGMLLSLISYSQNTPAQEQIPSGNKKEKTLEEKMEGTYIIINNNPKITQVLTIDILPEIEKRRDETKIVYYQYSEYITIEILPKNIITAPDFDPTKY